MPIPVRSIFSDEAVEGSLVDRFAQQVALYPDREALLTPEGSWTYGELDAWTSTIAQAIVGSIGTGKDPVCMLLDQGAINVAATLAVLKTGRPYVPVDLTEAERTILPTLRSTRATLVLCTTDFLERATALVRGLAHVMAIPAGAAVNQPPFRSLRIDKNDPAYIFFTSGTTGDPKGVKDSHRNVLHNVLRYTNMLGIGPGDRLTMMQSPIFSGTVSSMFGALLNGATLLPFDVRKEGLTSLTEWIKGSRATIYHSVPTIFRGVFGSGAHFPDVRVVRLEGDAADASDLVLFSTAFRKEAVLAHGLGTTETGLVRQAIFSGIDKVPDGRLPIGGPVPGVEMRIVEENGLEVPTGVIGEIEVRSEFIALGYWNNDALTRERFKDDPTDPTKRIYRTGDLGTKSAEGQVRHLGRKDGNFKVNGQWVDPTIIEQKLLSTGCFREVLVVALQMKASSMPIAYLVPNDEERPDLLTLRSELASSLPAHLMPTRFVFIDRIPLTPHGKIDHAALPGPVGEDEVFETPTTDHQKLIAAIWEEVLGVEPIGLKDHFFLLGGDSLRAALVAAKMEKEFAVSFSAEDLLLRPVLYDLAQWTERGGPTNMKHNSRPLKPAIFCVDWPGGTGWELAGLAQLLSHEHRFYTIPSCGLKDPWPLDASIRNMARACLQHIRSILPEGPFILAGNCYGGVVALEAAQMLQERGEAAPPVVLLQIGPRDFPTIVPPDDLRRCINDERLHRLGGRWQMVRQNALVDWIVEVKQLLERRLMHTRAKLEQRFRKDPNKRDTIMRNMHLLAHFALRDHRPERYSGSVSLFLSEDAVKAYSNDIHRTWAGLATTANIHVIPGTKDQLLGPKGVNKVARSILKDLEESIKVTANASVL